MSYVQIKSLPDRIVDEIISSIRQRRGIGNEWDMIDDSIQNEILDEWRVLIEEELAYEKELKEWVEESK